MSALKRLFDPKVNQSSPIQKDYVRVVNYDEDGNEYITYEEVDYKKLSASLGSVSDWSLNNLLSAGVNPNFPIHTGLNTRLDGVGVVADAASILDEMFAEFDKSENNEEKL